MSDDASPRLGLPYVAAGQAQKHVTVNEGLALLDALVACAVQSRTQTLQAGAPQDGMAWILPSGATGDDWGLRPAGTLARYEANGWTAPPTPAGQIVYVKDEDRLLVRTAAGAWRRLADDVTSLAGASGVGIGATPDAANPLVVRGPGALFTAADAGFQVRINKAAAGQTGSLLFQDAYGGRAEIGLCGDDRLHVKVSADGATWTEAMVVDGAGRVGLGVAAPSSRLQVDGAVRVKSYARTALPSAAGEGAGALIHVPDEAGGATLAFSDGAVWRRVHDRQAVA